MKVPALSEVLQILEQNQELDLPMDPAFYERLHDKIMKAVDQIPPKRKSRPQNPEFLKNLRNLSARDSSSRSLAKS